MAGRERTQDFRMRQIDARGSAERRVAVESEGVALVQVDGAAGEGAEPQLRSLQIDEDADRAAGLFLERADHRHPLAHDVMRGMAHVDAEDVGAGGEQVGDGLAVARGGAEGGDDLDARRRRACTCVPPTIGGLPPRSFLPGAGREPAFAAQGFAWSVSCTVQLLASLPVSTSKKPVRL